MKKLLTAFYISQCYLKQALALFHLSNIFYHSGKLAKMKIKDYRKGYKQNQKKGEYRIFYKLVFANLYAYVTFEKIHYINIASLNISPTVG